MTKEIKYPLRVHVEQDIISIVQSDEDGTYFAHYLRSMEEANLLCNTLNAAHEAEKKDKSPLISKIRTAIETATMTNPSENDSIEHIIKTLSRQIEEYYKSHEAEGKGIEELVEAYAESVSKDLRDLLKHLFPIVKLRIVAALLAGRSSISGAGEKEAKLDLKELERKLDHALNAETKESLTDWLLSQRIDLSQSVSELRGWISVKEDTPDAHRPVCIDNGSGVGLMRTNYTWYDVINKTDVHVRFWQPLPAAPTDKKG